jgi:hypothetical protein
VTISDTLSAMVRHSRIVAESVPQPVTHHADARQLVLETGAKSQKPETSCLRRFRESTLAIPGGGLLGDRF